MLQAISGWINVILATLVIIGILSGVVFAVIFLIEFVVVSLYTLGKLSSNSRR